MPPVNPYLKPAAAAAAAKEKENVVPQSIEMGPQSQRRLTLKERTHKLQSESHNNKKRKKGGQQTLFGDRAFDSLVDCEVCKARQWGRSVHRAHHKLCSNNRRTRGMSEASLSLAQQEKQLRLHFTTPLSESEKCSSKYATKHAGEAFFTPREISQAATKFSTTITATMEASVVTSNTAAVATIDFCSAVTAIINNPRHAEFHNGRAPVAMLAFAKVVVDNIILSKDLDISSHFDGLTITGPANQNTSEPHHHSIVGQQLLYVDWKRMHGLDITCPRCRQCHLKNDRTNYSKNKILFPIFGLDGPPKWCMVQSMICPCCRSRINANSGEILCTLPAYARSTYPVETKYAPDNKNCHLGKSATNVMDLIMPTYGNGDLCSRLLYSAINRAYIERVEACYSAFGKEGTTIEGGPKTYLEKDGGFITAYPPLGDGIRDTYDASLSNQFNPWGFSDHDRHTREIQSVKCHLIFAQDHTHEVTKNYYKKKQLGATALWDVSTETGEIASAMLVPATKTIHLAHAATALTRQEAFTPSVMYSDTWPVKSDFWNLLIDRIEGRLGLFHYIQRVTKTLKKKHTDHFTAINSLLDCIYHYNVQDYENLLRALKEGTLSVNSKYSDDDIRALKATKAFRQRYDRYLRKEIRPPHIMSHMLDDWFDRFKCTASDNSRPARGRYDPVTGETLFSPETKEAIRLAKVNAKYLQDPLPLDQMYFVIEPNPNSQHQLKEYMSRRGESSLESFHLMLAHFGNCGMRTSLVDNLNLTGTARYNLTIRHKLRLTSLTQGSRKKIPAGFECVVSYFNHSELEYVNSIASATGIPPLNLPFKNVEKLLADNGERFFSEYITWMNETKPRYDLQNRCLCEVCHTVQTKQMEEPGQQLKQSTNEPTQPVVAPPVVDPAVTPINGNQPMATNKPTSNSSTTDTAHKAATNVHPQKQVLMQPQPQPQPHQHNHQGLTIQPPSQQHQYAPQPLMMGYWSPMPQLFHAYPPWITTQYTTTTPATFCCSRYRHWYNAAGRRGRPPHDGHCQRTGGMSEKNRNNNPSWKVI